MILADFRVQMLFRLGIFIQLISIAIAAAGYYFITTLFRGESAIMGRYGTNVVSYILLGLTMNPVLVTSLTGIYSALESTYLTRALERIMMAPTSVYTLFFSRMSSGYFSSLITSALYLLVGIAIFRMHVGSGNPLGGLLILVLGVFSTIALGLLLAQIFFYTHTGKGSSASVILFVQTVVNLFAGAAFPVEILPWPLRWISFGLPQTHAIRGARLILAGHALTDQQVLADMLYRVGFSVIVMPVGVLLMRRGLDRLRREGYSPQTRMMGVTVFG